jgi:hypothetical protein
LKVFDPSTERFVELVTVGSSRKPFLEEIPAKGLIPREP